MSFWFLGLIAVGGLMAQTPTPVMDVFLAAGEALANQNSAAFLDQFDQDMPGFAKLRDEIQELVAVQEASSTVDVVTDEGDDKKHVLSLDWVLRIGSERPRRQVVKCTVEKQGKRWKITSLDPVEFFKK